MGVSVRVPGFLPTMDGLHFKNKWPPGTGPDYTLRTAQLE